MDQRQTIIDSVFSRRNAAGVLEETYVSHVKIWEDAGAEGGGRKPRYILLSQALNGNGFLHKSKLNTNGTFSVGKTWRLAELRALQVVNALSFNISLSRTYKWQTEDPSEQSQFLQAVIQLFRTTSPDAPLRLEGISESKSSQSVPKLNATPTRRPNNRPPPLNEVSSERQYEQRNLSPPPPRSQSRSGLNSRPASPANSSRAYSSARGSSRQAERLPEPLPSPQPRPRPAAKATPPAPPSLQPSSSISSLPERAPSIASIEPPSPLPRSSKRPGATAAPVDGSGPSRRDQNARISFFDPGNQAALDRLITNSTNEEDGEEESAQSMMSNVEEMIEGYEWAIDDVIGRKSSRGAADLIEARLLDELLALEKANIHSFLESDDLIEVVLKYMDEAVAELDNMEGLVSSYKIHLNAVGDDISFIQGQNRGLQVQNQNQRALLSELENLLQTTQVNKDALAILTQESLEKSSGIQRLEEAATELYKALLAGQDTDMAATMQRLQEYRSYNTQFCKRIFDFLSIMFTAQSQMLLGSTDGLLKAGGRGKPSIIPHQDLEQYLGRYAGLMLYLKEMDEKIYERVCGTYFSASSELHKTQMKSLLSIYINLVRKASEDDQEHGFGPPPATGTIAKGATGMRRAGTIIRSPLEARNRDKDKTPQATLAASEVLILVLEQIAPLMYREDEFIADFLQINEAVLTFADYADLDNYFRRQASRTAGLSQSTMKLVRQAMELIFGFLPEELKSWLDKALAKDSMQIVGLLASMERFIAEADDRAIYLLNVLGKQQMRLKSLFDRHVNDQIRDIEQTKLNSKKRKGVVPFIKHFPSYVSTVEDQLIRAESLEVRSTVDAAYDRIVQSMFESLKQMAKLDGEGEDKGQLNFHVILIENMHHFISETSQIQVGSVASFVRTAEAIYDENLTAYVKLVLRRPFGKLMDYFDGIERLLKTAAPSEISSNSNYNKSALKKVVKEFNAKDIRKNVDALYKRVEKHFNEGSEKAAEESKGIVSGTVLVGVWKACEDELIRFTDTAAKRITQCYGDSGVTLDYTRTDVEGAFRRHRGF